LGLGSLAHVHSKVAINKVEINIFMSTSMFNQIQARPQATMVAEMASIVAHGSPSYTNRPIT
jgi:hypothetical protein